MKWIYFFAAIVLTTSSCGVSKSVADRPNLQAYNDQIPPISISNDTFSVLADNQLRKNQYDLWELYVHGDPLERGLITGALAEDLIQKQERIFFDKVKELVPSERKQKFLRRFLAWYNRKLYQYIPNEYKAEIYGISRYASDDYADIADNYLRSLYLHGAHDIGHALQDLALVGCSSFAVWGDKTEDGSLIVGRNFDFYAGDDFAQDKIVAFVKPTEGYSFMSVTWGGMIGVVSGMNDQGLTVTINAGKSGVPLIARTPISIVNREILQYAKNIEEAIAIARKRAVFVSESIFIASANDGRAVTIEVSPKKFGVYEVPNSNQLICSNHFQSSAYAKDKKNLQTIEESHSQYRFDRMQELLEEHPKITPQIAVDILRNRDGLEDKKIGYGNEKALNQLLAHHAVVFKPEQGLTWVSTNPYQLGAFVAYDLQEVFRKVKSENPQQALSEAELTIEKDPFLFTETYQQYENFRSLRRLIMEKTEKEEEMETNTLMDFQNSNPDYWEVHFLLGKYFYELKNYPSAAEAFQTALTKEITTVPDRKILEKYLKKSKRKFQ